MTYTGAPGTLIGALTSMSTDGQYAFEVPVKDPLAGMGQVGGSYPWRLDGDFRTVLHLKNVTGESVYADVQVRYAGGVYSPDHYLLRPYETIAVDIHDLAKSGAKDVRGPGPP